MEKQMVPRLIAWYKENQRRLPWRETHNPYAVVVSEMMLQQTQVNTVIGYFERFMKKFPDFNALAAADEQEVLSVWQGLGYYSRARNLHRLAGTVAGEYHGQLPQDIAELKKLPGIGDYMAGAVMSIGFNIPSPAVDGNVMRVSTRLDGIDEDITKQKTKRMVFNRISEILPNREAGDFTQAFMELGALVCKPVSLRCEDCPVCAFCEAYKKGWTEKLPVTTPKQKPKVVKTDIYIVTEKENLLMHHRPSGGLLAHMWGLPVVQENAASASGLISALNLSKEQMEYLGETHHTFTHQRWEMRVFAAVSIQSYPIQPPYFWQPLVKIVDLPVPVAFKKALSLHAGIQDFM